MVDFEDLQNLISYGEHSVMLEFDGKNEMICSFVEITEEIFDARYYRLCKESLFPIIYEVLFSLLLKELKPTKGITDDNYETLKMMKKEKLGFIIYWEIGNFEKWLLLL